MEHSIQQLKSNHLTSWSEKGVMFSEFNERHADQFLEALETNTSLKEIALQGPAYEQHLFYNKEKCRRLFDAITQLPSVESLEIISGCSLEKDHVMAIMAIQPLARLVLKNCIRIFSHSVPLMFQMALQKHPSLTHVELRNIYMVGYAAGQEQAIPRLDPILDALASIPHIQHAVLSCTAGTLYSYRGPLHSAKCMAKLIEKSSLKSFKAEHLRITDKDLECIANHLGPNLESLRLSSYHPDESQEKVGPGLYELVQLALAPTSTIKVLTIEGFTCMDSDYDPILSRTPLEGLVLSLLQHNYTIEELKIPGLSSETRTIVEMYLRLNRAGRRYLQNPKVSPSTLTDILVRLKDCPNSILYVLHRNPGLICR